MRYTLQELRALVADTEELPGDTEVRIAHQPNYPHQVSVMHAKVVTDSEHDPEEIRRDMDDGTLTPEEITIGRGYLAEYAAAPKVIYFCEGSYIGYADHKLWNAE